MPYVLWIGMNPSSAAEDEDDKTVRWEQEMTWRWGYNRYVKMNVGTYRATQPADLARLGGSAVWPSNIERIAISAGYASKIIAATGNLPDVLKPYGLSLFRRLHHERRQLICFGKTKYGWPRHTSRLSYDTPEMEFKL